MFRGMFSGKGTREPKFDSIGQGGLNFISSKNHLFPARLKSMIPLLCFQQLTDPYPRGFGNLFTGDEATCSSAATILLLWWPLLLFEQ